MSISMSKVLHPVAWKQVALGNEWERAVKVDLLIRLPYLAMCGIGRYHERLHVTSKPLLLTAHMMQSILLQHSYT